MYFGWAVWSIMHGWLKKQHGIAEKSFKKFSLKLLGLILNIQIVYSPWMPTIPTELHPTIPDDAAQPFLSSFNKHMGKKLMDLREHQTHSVKKIIDAVEANGVIGEDGERMLPLKVHKALKSFLEVRNTQLVDIYVL